MYRFINLTDDVINLITDYMDSHTFANFRFIYNRKWSVKQVKKYGRNRIIVFEHKRASFPNFGYCLPYQIEHFPRCVHCGNDAMSFVKWISGHKRRWIPWCNTHAPPDVMSDVASFCIYVCNYAS